MESADSTPETETLEIRAAGQGATYWGALSVKCSLRRRESSEIFLGYSSGKQLGAKDGCWLSEIKKKRGPNGRRQLGVCRRFLRKCQLFSQWVSAMRVLFALRSFAETHGRVSPLQSIRNHTRFCKNVLKRCQRTQFLRKQQGLPDAVPVFLWPGSSSVVSRK